MGEAQAGQRGLIHGNRSLQNFPTMTPRTIKLPNVQVNNQRAIITADRGVIYDDITIRLGNTGAANLNAPALNAVAGLVEVIMNGGTQRKALATQIDAKQALFGAKWASQAYAGNTYELPNANGNGRRDLKILFREPRARFNDRSIDVEQLGWKTAWLPENKPLQIQIANVLGNANMSVEAWATVRDGDDSATRGPNKIIKWFAADNVLGANPTTLNNWAQGVTPGDKFVAMSLFNSSGGKSVNQVLLEAGGAKFFEEITRSQIVTDLLGTNLDPAGADAIAAAVHLIFDRYELIEDALPAFASTLLRVTMSAAANGETLPMIVERYGKPEGAA
jgi:hypothetical protein